MTFCSLQSAQLCVDANRLRSSGLKAPAGSDHTVPKKMPMTPIPSARLLRIADSSKSAFGPATIRGQPLPVFRRFGECSLNLVITRRCLGGFMWLFFQPPISLGPETADFNCARISAIAPRRAINDCEMFIVTIVDLP